MPLYGKGIGETKADRSSHTQTHQSGKQGNEGVQSRAEALIPTTTAKASKKPVGRLKGEVREKDRMNLSSPHGGMSPVWQQFYAAVSRQSEK